LASKNPKTKREPQPSKTPKVGFDENPLRLRPAWRIGAMEMCDPFGWHRIHGTLLLEIREKLRNFETMTWSQIIGPQSHMVSRDSLCKNAQERLVQLKLDEIDELFSLRLSGKERVWGLLEHNVLTLLMVGPRS
jgi:hypothetical protein